MGFIFVNFYLEICIDMTANLKRARHFYDSFSNIFTSLHFKELLYLKILSVESNQNSKTAKNYLYDKYFNSKINVCLSRYNYNFLLNIINDKKLFVIKKLMYLKIEFRIHNLNDLNYFSFEVIKFKKEILQKITLPTFHWGTLRENVLLENELKINKKKIYPNLSTNQEGQMLKNLSDEQIILTKEIKNRTIISILNVLVVKTKIKLFSFLLINYQQLLFILS